MGLECELKYLEVDLNRLSLRLKDGGGEYLGKYFESNLVFDRGERELKGAGVLLRLREKQGVAVLTVKRPPELDIESTLKVYEEIETSVGDPVAMRASLEIIGFSVAFAYEKVREKWRFMDCVLCLDHLPYGDYVEIEGTEDSVFECAAALGINTNPTSKLTYHALNLEHRSANGLKPDESFVFGDEERERLRAEFDKV